jgi:SynChlorMet cassette radical SAM/SPASM protein ScmF
MAVERVQLPEGVPQLNTYYIYLTGGCNLACRHCWIAPTYQANGDTGGHLDYDLFALAIDEGLPLGLSSVKLTGGEPLLHPDFIRMVDLLREKGIQLTLETNGTLLTRSLVQSLKDNSTLSSISVSLDGAKSETHDSFRGVKGSFEKAVQGIRYLVEAGIYPQVIMSLFTGNVDEIEALVQLTEDLGASSVKFNIIQPTGRGGLMTERGQTLGVERLLKLGKWLDTEVQQRSSISLYYSWPMAFYNTKKLLTFNGYSCSIFNILGILHTGHLAMCGIGEQEADLCYGQLGVDRLVDVWCTNPILVKLRQQLPAGLEGVCGECIFRDRCLGMCVAENYYYYRSLTAPYWFCQDVAELGLFPASRRSRK